jgi:hypothetical protein
VVGDYNGHVGLGVKCAKEVATAIRGAIIQAKMCLVPVRRGYWGNKIGKVHTVPTKITGETPSWLSFLSLSLLFILLFLFQLVILLHALKLTSSPLPAPHFALPSSPFHCRQVRLRRHSPGPRPPWSRHHRCPHPQEGAADGWH